MPQKQSRAEPETPDKETEYESPELEILGSVVELTLGGAGGLGDATFTVTPTAPQPS